MAEFLHFDIQSTGQKSHRVDTVARPPRCYVLIKQSDSPSHCQFRVRRSRPLFGRPPREGGTAEAPGVDPASSGLARRQARDGTPGPRRKGPEATRRPEPILLPKLRIRLADFPYPHCSTGQRLLTSETCCGHEYERRPRLGRNRVRPVLARIFKDPRRHAGRRGKRDALPRPPPSLRTIRFQGGRRRVNEKRQLSPGPSRASPGPRCVAARRAFRFGNVDPIPFRRTGALSWAPLRPGCGPVS